MSHVESHVQSPATIPQRLEKYRQFLQSKLISVPASGFTVSADEINSRLFPFQRSIVSWALRRGKAALFLDTGLGKTLQQLEWAANVCHHTAGSVVYGSSGGKVLILCPLAVGRQTLLEAAKFGVSNSVAVNVCSSQESVQPGITITNYQKLHKFDPSEFAGVVLDESSILKSKDGCTKEAVIETFRHTPFKLACTATPAPNDIQELGNHFEFLGIMSSSEMLATYFTHDGGNTSKWRLRGHAEREFYRCLAQFAVMIRRPSDLGFSDDGYILPPLNVHRHVVRSSGKPPGSLFDYADLPPHMTKTQLHDRARLRRETMGERGEVLDQLTNSGSSKDEAWVVWCKLNDESSLCADIVTGSTEVRGNLKDWEKEQRLIGFTDGEYRAIVSKSGMCGFGLNWQHSHKMAFFGIDDSYEQFKQAVARQHRFGQKFPVDVHLILSDRDGDVWENLERKRLQAESMAGGMVEAMAEASRQEIGGVERIRVEYQAQRKLELPEFLK